METRCGKPCEAVIELEKENRFIREELKKQYKKRCEICNDRVCENSQKESLQKENCYIWNRLNTDFMFKALEGGEG